MIHCKQKENILINKPGGTGMVIFFLCTLLPFPSHSVQGNFIIILVPWQYLQVDLIMKGPVILMRPRKNGFHDYKSKCT